MKLLLDTHIWIWSLVEPRRLSKPVRTALQDKSNQLWLSPLSIWELIILRERGRVTLEGPLEPWIKQAKEKAPMQEATLTTEVVLAVKKVTLPHRDPVDWFLAATAQYYSLTLVTADKALLAGSGFTTLN